MVGGGGRLENVEKGEVKLGIEELIRGEDAWKPFWARGRDLVGYSINGLRTAGLRFEETGTERSSEVVRLVMDQQETQRLLDVSCWLSSPSTEKKRDIIINYCKFSGMQGQGGQALCSISSCRTNSNTFDQTS